MEPLDESSGPRGSIGFWASGAAVVGLVAGAVLVGPLAEGPVSRVAVLLLVGGAGLAWWLALRQAREGAGSAWAVVLGALFLRAVVLFGADPELSDDAHRYLWEGQLVLSGESPYALAPNDSALAPFRERMPAIHAAINHPDVAAAYPPGAQAAFAGIVALATGLGGVDLAGEPGPALFVVRAAFAVCDLLVLIPLALLLRRRGLPGSLLVAWGWSPLVALEFAGAGHFDALAIGLWFFALALLDTRRGGGEREVEPEGRGVGGALLLGSAICVKLLPVASLPFVVRGRGGLLRVGIVIGLCLAASVPFLLLGAGPWVAGGGLAQYALRWESTPLLYRFVEDGVGRALVALEWDVDPRIGGRAAIAGLWSTTLAWLWFRRVDMVRASGILIGLFLVLSPTLHPWYLTWFAPFLALGRGRAFAWLLGAAPLLYWPLVGWRAGEGWKEPVWLWPAFALPFLALLLLDLLPRHDAVPPR